ADGLTHEVGSLHTFFHFVRNHVSPVASRESHYESEVSLFDSSQVDGQMFFHLQRYIAFVIVSRFTVGCCINAEHGEIATVTGPHPVIGVSYELSDGRRRSAYHTDIFIDGLYKQVIAVGSVER